MRNDIAGAGTQAIAGGVNELAREMVRHRRAVGGVTGGWRPMDAIPRTAAQLAGIGRTFWSNQTSEQQPDRRLRAGHSSQQPVDSNWDNNALSAIDRKTKFWHFRH
jgi:hypothetical protein